MLSCYSMSLERGRLTLTEKEKDMTFEEEVSSETEEIEKDETTELKEKIDQLEDQNLRLQAEIQNMRRRNQNEREANAKYRSQDLAKAILPASPEFPLLSLVQIAVQLAQMLARFRFAQHQSHHQHL